MLVAGLDVGTSSCKFTVYDDCRVLLHTVADYRAFRKGSIHTLDANVVWRSVEQAIQEAIIREPAARHIKAIAVSSFGEAFVPLDRDGNVLGPSFLFWDERGSREIGELSNVFGAEAIWNQTGVIPHPMFTIGKWMWTMKAADYREQVAYFPLFEDFIIYRMTGEKLISYSLAGRTMAFDLEKREWANNILGQAHLDADMLSKPVPSGTIAGVINSETACRLGLSKKTYIVTGGHDQMCAAVGSGAVTAGIGGNGCGTVEALTVTLANTCDVKLLRENTYSRSIHANVEDCFTYSFGSTGSMALNWFIELFGVKAQGEAFEELARYAPVTPTGLLVLPYLAGTGTPWMDLNARGLFSGIGLNTSKYDLYKAILEGMTYDLSLNIQKLEQSGNLITELHVSGGGADSDLWMQLKADITGKVVCRMANSQAGTFGCAILALKAMGRFISLLEGVHEAVVVKETFYPDNQNNIFYREETERFKEWYLADSTLRKI